MAVDCEKLKNAIGKGVLSVGTGEDQVTYRSLDEMIKIHELFCGPIEPEVASESANTPALATSYARFCKRGTR